MKSLSYTALNYVDQASFELTNNPRPLKFFSIKIIFIYVSVCMGYLGQWRLESARSPGAGVTGDELTDGDAERETQVLQRSNKCS